MVKTILAKIVRKLEKAEQGNLGDPGKRTTLCFLQSDVLGSFRSQTKIAQMLNKYNYSERWQLEPKNKENMAGIRNFKASHRHIIIKQWILHYIDGTLWIYRSR